MTAGMSLSPTMRSAVVSQVLGHCYSFETVVSPEVAGKTLENLSIYKEDYAVIAKCDHQLIKLKRAGAAEANVRTGREHNPWSRP